MHAATLRKVTRGDAVAPATLRKLGATVSPANKAHDSQIMALTRTRKAEDYLPSKSVKRARDVAPWFGWSLSAIKSAREDQLRGHFRAPVRLAEAMRTDDALFVARTNRIAPQSALTALLVGVDTARGEAVRRKASELITIPRNVLAGINGTLADHGIAIGYNEHTVIDGGTAVEFTFSEWPLEFVRWDSLLECLVTQTHEGVEVPILHGDGTWTVFSKHAEKPWRGDACILPGALIWAAHAHGLKDWAQSSRAHGMASIIGELPEGFDIGADGQLTPQADAFLRMLQDIVSGDAGAGIMPHGAKADFVASGSNAWQVFSELLVNREKAAARVYLGTDGVLGSTGGAPGVDISALFGVATTRIQGDLEAIERGLRSGVYEPWTAINYGDTKLSPGLKYQLPDPDAEAKQKNFGERMTGFATAIEQLRERGFIVDQSVVDSLAAKFGVPAFELTPAPAKPPVPPQGSPDVPVLPAQP